MSNKSDLEKLVKQLRIEANLERIQVSVACEDLIVYCLQNQIHDKLLFPDKSKDKRQRKRKENK